ncbi:hypothetical protein SASPL_110642 [Salvia splendens]|uniref:Pectinesterase inhibitor domain-containing protein n=1 Tax=Salvia splendens TaxID=180675 RepID=A0A8X9A4E5_SALSN|nr:hypothetical protein SASPL_110642 [Salvia splendens]
MRSTMWLCVAVVAAGFMASASASASFCDTADDKVLCGQLVGSAGTWAKAMTNALNGVQKRAEGGKSVADVVAAKLPADVLPQTKDAIVSTCHWGYDNIMDNVKECIEFVKDDPTSALKSHLSAMSYSDCTDGLSEFNLSVPEATQFDDEMQKLSSALLAVAEKRP